MRDVDSHAVAVNAITPQTLTSGSGAVNSGDQDLQGFYGALLTFAIGDNGGDTLNGTNKFELKLEHAEDDGDGAADSYAAVDADDVVGATPDGSGNVVIVDDAAEDDQIYQMAYVGNRRFIKATLTPQGTLANGNPAALALVKMLPTFVPAS